MSEILSVQLTAAATLALAVLAFLTAALAYLAWRKQSREVSDQAEMLDSKPRKSGRQLPSASGRLTNDGALRRSLCTCGTPPSMSRLTGRRPPL